mmetsp:Transcript_43161/g.92053  ORF Transcript_43161/g.92053 Transcript_43161/m.92053 type:complete len:231 (+) Transcript_43161:1017-1709(+)
MVLAQQPLSAVGGAVVEGQGLLVLARVVQKHREIVRRVQALYVILAQVLHKAIEDSLEDEAHLLLRHLLPLYQLLPYLASRTQCRDPLNLRALALFCHREFPTSTLQRDLRDLGTPLDVQLESFVQLHCHMLLVLIDAWRAARCGRTRTSVSVLSTGSGSRACGAEARVATPSRGTFAVRAAARCEIALFDVGEGATEDRGLVSPLVLIVPPHCRLIVDSRDASDAGEEP